MVHTFIIQKLGFQEFINKEKMFIKNWRMENMKESKHISLHLTNDVQLVHSLLPCTSSLFSFIFFFLPTNLKDYWKKNARKRR